MKRRLVLLTVLSLLVAVIPATASLAAPKKPHPVRVAADADPLSSWVSSGVTVTAGDPLEITARGQAITGPLSQFPGAKSGPDGQVTICPDSGGPLVGCALDGVPYGALVARIGGGTPFLVGASYSMPAPGTGLLEFAVNDNLGFYFDNNGGFTVFVNR